MEDLVDVPEALTIVKAREAVDLDEIDPTESVILSSPNSASSSPPSTTSNCWFGSLELVPSLDVARKINSGALMVVSGVVSAGVSAVASPAAPFSVLGASSCFEVDDPEESWVLIEREDLLSSTSDWPWAWRRATISSFCIAVCENFLSGNSRL